MIGKRKTTNFGMQDGFWSRSTRRLTSLYGVASGPLRWDFGSDHYLAHSLYVGLLRVS